jgi:hypothetical protein
VTQGGGAQSFSKMTEWKRGHVGREAACGSVAGAWAGRGSVVGAWTGGISRPEHGRAGLHGTKPRARGMRGGCVGGSVGHT